MIAAITITIASRNRDHHGTARQVPVRAAGDGRDLEQVEGAGGAGGASGDLPRRPDPQRRRARTEIFFFIRHSSLLSMDVFIGDEVQLLFITLCEFQFIY
jgi:hypothetical protein